MQIETIQNTSVFLQQALSILASEPDPRQSAILLLDSALAAVGATGANFLVFGDAEFCVLAGEATQPKTNLEGAFEALAPGIHSGPALAGHKIKGSYVAAPLHTGDTLLGAFILNVPKGFDPQDPQQKVLLETLRDALSILANSAQAVELKDRAEQRTISIVNSIKDPILVVDDDQCLLFMNPAAEQEFNTSIETARGDFLQDIVQSDELMQFAADRNSNRREWTSEAEKTYVPHTEPVLDQDGNVEGWVMVLRDITHYKKLNRNQSEFTRIVSHDLRSPLTSMQGYADMLELQLVGELNEKQAQFVDKILAGVTQMTELVDNIQDAGRYDPETGFYDMSRSHCDISDLVNRIADNYLVPAEKQELELSVRVADDVPIINADNKMLERAVINLVDNAIKYTPNGGKVAVHAKTKDEQLLISISDTGYGISPENLKRLFERHMRIPRKEHRGIKGSGLGLFIVKSVAQRHGGDAWVESKEGKGSTFFISIPLEGPNLIGADNDAE